MRVIHIMSGVPGSGKTTYISERAVSPDNVVLHRDDFRDSLRTVFDTNANYFPVRAYEEQHLWGRCIMETIERSSASNIWIDQTTPSMASLSKLIPYLPEKDVLIYVHRLNVPLGVAFLRNKQRNKDKLVPDNIIKSMYYSWAKDKITVKKFNDLYPDRFFVIDVINNT